MQPHVSLGQLVEPMLETGLRQGPQPSDSGLVLVCDLIGTSRRWAASKQNFSAFTAALLPSRHLLSSASWLISCTIRFSQEPEPYCEVHTLGIQAAHSFVSSRKHYPAPPIPVHGKIVFHQTLTWHWKGWALVCCVQSLCCTVCCWVLSCSPVTQICLWDHMTLVKM